MKNKLLTVVLAILVLHLFAWTLAAQEEEKSPNKMYFIHEDVVKPSKIAEFEKAVKGYQEALAKYGMTDLKNLVIQTDDMVYSYVSEVENMAVLDQRPFDDLKEKMGEESFDALFDAYDGLYKSHKSYIVTLQADLSYTPENASDSEDMNFRHWDMLHFIPGKGKEAREIVKEWKALYESKKSPMAYRTYTGGLGTETPFYIFSLSAKNAAAFYAQAEKNDELLGEEMKELEKRTLAITDKFEHLNGHIRPDLSYLPPEEEMTAK